MLVTIETDQAERSLILISLLLDTTRILHSVSVCFLRDCFNLRPRCTMEVLRLLQVSFSVDPQRCVQRVRSKVPAIALDTTRCLRRRCRQRGARAMSLLWFFLVAPSLSLTWAKPFSGFTPSRHFQPQAPTTPGARRASRFFSFGLTFTPWLTVQLRTRSASTACAFCFLNTAFPRVYTRKLTDNCSGH